MSLWFNSDVNPSDWSVFDPVTDTIDRSDCTFDLLYHGYCEYAQALASPYFISPDPSNPRIVTDTEFLGTY
jgi:hypothetical protein